MAACTRTPLLRRNANEGVESAGSAMGNVETGKLSEMVAASCPEWQVLWRVHAPAVTAIPLEVWSGGKKSCPAAVQGLALSADTGKNGA